MSGSALTRRRRTLAAPSSPALGLHPLRDGSPSCGRHVAAALRAPPPAAPPVLPLSVIASNAATKRSPVALPDGSPVLSVCQSSSTVLDDDPLSSTSEVRKYGRPPGPSDRSPGSIPPGAASPRPAPRSPLRGLRPSGDDPWRLRSLRSLRASLAGAVAKPVHDRRRGSVAPLPSPAALSNLRDSRITARRFAPPPLALASPPFRGPQSPSASQQARRYRAIAVARPLSLCPPQHKSATAHHSSSDIALPRPALRAMALRTGRCLPPKPWHSPRTSRPYGQAARPCR